MYFIVKYVCILLIIQVLGANALTPDNEGTNEFTLIYEHIQAILTYMCKPKKRAKEYVPNTDIYKHIRIIRTFCRIPILTT